MKLLPYENLTIESKLTVEEVTQKIQENINQSKQQGRDKFYGWVSGSDFEIYRRGRNSFSPSLRGKVLESENGSKINLKMRIVSYVLVFIGIWFLFTLFALVSSIYSYITNGEIELLKNVVFMLTFGYVITISGFYYGSSNSKNDLLRLVKGKIEGK